VERGSNDANERIDARIDASLLQKMRIPELISCSLTSNWLCGFDSSSTPPGKQALLEADRYHVGLWLQHTCGYRQDDMHAEVAHQGRCSAVSQRGIQHCSDFVTDSMLSVCISHLAHCDGCLLPALWQLAKFNQSITRFSSKRGTQKGSHSQTTFGAS
jgi:hypothetical protein